MKMAHYLDRYVNESHDFAWRTFDCVKAILLSKKGVKKWKTPGEPALVSTLLSTLFEQRHLEWTARYLWTSGPGKDVEKIVASGLLFTKSQRSRPRERMSNSGIC